MIRIGSDLFFGGLDLPRALPEVHRFRLEAVFGQHLLDAEIPEQPGQNVGDPLHGESIARPAATAESISPSPLSR